MARSQYDPQVLRPPSVLQEYLIEGPKPVCPRIHSGPYVEIVQFLEGVNQRPAQFHVVVRRRGRAMLMYSANSRLPCARRILWTRELMSRIRMSGRGSSKLGLVSLI